MNNESLFLYQFVKIYYHQHKKQALSDDVAKTIACLFEAYYLLKKRHQSVTIARLCQKAGFSRTTFYKLFVNLPALKKEFADLLLYHIDYYSKEYFTFYTKRGPSNFNRVYDDVLSMIKYFTIFMNEPGFMKRHKNALKNMFLKEAPCPASYSEHQRTLYQYLVECFAAYSSDIVLYYYQNEDKRSLTDHLYYAQIISNELIKIFTKIKNKEI